ncbi:hypothetical protein PR202_gb20688 [Eleusine coracana subsp. coracana]|uniref:Uncharacterized protein n=1 Tax=Eleusine coracana subsp. coracana TaxID=191504 RepID=A0AAV5F964_ELECO|nr:hypothetical protein PR202_gb20688 [Eleusine coracana subsp. coracana]
MAGARSTPTRTPPSPASRTEPVVPSDWAAAISLFSSHSAPPVVVMCGPKNSGKSTFSRLLLNELLPRQALSLRSDPNPSSNTPALLLLL